jgi:hypothetical protein
LLNPDDPLANPGLLVNEENPGEKDIKPLVSLSKIRYSLTQEN